MLRIAMRIGRRVVFIAIAYAFVAFVTNVLGPPTVAQAAPVSADFRIALEPFGAWRHSNRFGDVWVPVNRARDWRPYTVGHWIYTDDLAGTGSPTIRKPIGAGLPTTTGTGISIANSDGSGYPAMSGLRPGSPGAAVTNMSAGRRTRPTRS